MKRSLLGFSSVLALSAAFAAPAMAEMNFNRISSFGTYLNAEDGKSGETTSAEIIDVTADGMTLVYTDSPMEVIGLIDITDPAMPKPLGNVEVGGEPTSVAVIGNVAYVGVNTSESYVAPSGNLKAIDLGTKAEVAMCDLGGQPDSVAVAKDGSFVTVAIENERDEDLNDGELPQFPAGYVVIVPTKGAGLDCAAMIKADVTGLAEIGASDPEPEFVDVNGLGEIVVTMQENNHMVILSSKGEVLNHFSAGAVDLMGLDRIEEGKLSFTQDQLGRKREPDAVKWIDDNHFAIANEGDYEGGSRGWTIFHKDGTEVYESGLSFEYEIIKAGHYPEERSKNKGVEPESVEVGTFGGKPVVFIGAERSSIVGVYDVSDLSAPVLMQLLPSGIGPEGYVAIDDRNLLVSANEEDMIEDGGPRSHVMLFEYQNAAPMFPTLKSTNDETGKPIGWGAISGMVADEDVAGKLYAVNDSFYAGQPSIFEIDATQKPAIITKRILVTREDLGAAQNLDLEGITTDGKGGFILASEGRMDRNRPHTLLFVDGEGVIDKELPLPEAMLDNAIRFGMEGVTRVGNTLWIAMQREWQDDPKGKVKLVSYNMDTKEWGAVHYPTEAAEKGWVGLSEITAHDGKLYIVERDNQINERAKIKRVYTVELDGLKAAPLGGDLPSVEKTLYNDLLEELASFNGYIVDKVEGFAIDAAGTKFVSTDNDGVDDSSGETHFFTVD